MKRAADETGMLLIAVVVAMTVLLGGIFALRAVAFLDVRVTNEEVTNQRLAKLVEAIGGIPEAQASITQGTSGFVGDMGRFPKSLEELNDTAATHTLCSATFTPAAPPAFHVADGGTNHRGKVGMGWRGPYYKEMTSTDEHLRDAWGVKFRYTCPESTRTEDGVSLTVRTGLITSAGPDGLFESGDDIKSDTFYDRGHLFLTITQGGNDKTANPSQVVANLYLPSNGEQTTLTTSIVSIGTDEGAEEVAVFASVPAGIRFLQIDFGNTKKELFHTFLKSNVANDVNVKIPIGQGGKG